MDPVEPWIDADAVRRLARNLAAPPRRTAPTDAPDDAGFGPGFEGFIETQAPATAEPSPAPAPSATPANPATPPPLPPSATRAPVEKSEPEPEARPFLAAAPSKPATPPPAADGETRPLVSRLERFRQWLTEQLDASGAFILERDGEPVLDDPKFAKLHFLARSLAQAYRPVEGKVGNVHVKVGADSYLAVVPVDTPFGRLVLGTVLPRPLEAASVEIVADALKRAASPPQR